jgi:NAD(P)-dependent dehydrogenase (short-subunit alcohol dehydrogenase family)
MRADTAEQPAAVRHAVVTGASSGIGRAIAARLLAEGWRVTGLCRTAPAEPVEGLEIALVDVTDFERLAEVCDGLGPVDALVHAAGFMRTAPLGELSAADGAAMWRVHVDAAAFLADKLAPRMPAGGRILLIGSRTANGAPTRSQYAATKAALVGMARSWAAELAPRGITVHVIAPGATDTPFLRDPARAQTPPRMPPIGRFIAPEEVGALAAFLAGEYGGAITGQQIVMCGGASL